VPMAITETPFPSSAPTEVTPDQHAPGDTEMTLLEHLEELRGRLVAAVVAVVVGVLASIIPLPVIGNSITWIVVDGLTEEGKKAGVNFITIRPGEGFFTYLSVALVVGAAIAMPVIIYQILAFVSPALYPQEKRYLYLAVPGVFLSFMCGVAFCYFLTLPFATRFLAGFASQTFTPTWSAEHYIDFVATFLFWVGVMFELPIIMFFLSKMGVVSAKRLAGYRKYAFVLAFVIGA